MERDSAVSLWDVSAAEPPVASAPLPDKPIDVAIVGGGYTGLATALFSAERGLSAHVLEAEKLGYGASGRNVGLVNAGIWLPPRDVVQALGPNYGPRFVKRFGGGPEFVFSLIEKHQIRCEVTRTGTIHAAHGPSGTAGLKDRYKAWRELGEPVELLSRHEVAEMTGTRHFYGGLLDHRCGTVNPMGYCRGLARAALGAGAKITTGAKVTGLTKDGARWRVETTQGTLLATAVILGTNAYTDDLWPDLAKIYTPIHYFQLATPPLGPEADHILPGRQGLWDTGKIMFNLRRDAFNRLLVGSMGTVLGDKTKGLSQRFAARQIARLFPDLGPVTFEEAWHGQIAMTPDHLPRIYELAPGLYAPTGYNGRGITTGTIFGEAMAGLLTGMDQAELPLPITALKTVPTAPVVSRLYQAAFTANQFFKGF